MGVKQSAKVMKLGKMKNWKQHFLWFMQKREEGILIVGLILQAIKLVRLRQAMQLSNKMFDNCLAWRNRMKQVFISCVTCGNCNHKIFGFFYIIFLHFVASCWSKAIWVSEGSLYQEIQPMEYHAPSSQVREHVFVYPTM